MATIIRFVLVILVFSCTPKERNGILDNSDDYRIICIGGHQYYERIYHLAGRLTDDGKPVKCGSL